MLINFKFTHRHKSADGGEESSTRNTMFLATTDGLERFTGVEQYPLIRLSVRKTAKATAGTISTLKPPDVTKATPDVSPVPTRSQVLAPNSARVTVSPSAGR
jgi:hypothetical protein